MMTPEELAGALERLHYELHPDPQTAEPLTCLTRAANTLRVNEAYLHVVLGNIERLEQQIERLRAVINNPCPFTDYGVSGWCGECQCCKNMREVLDDE
jgi:hypothetical protein